MVKNADMPEDMRNEAIEIALRGLSVPGTIERNVARLLKEEFDKRYSPTWHCIVGTNFGSWITHDSGCFLSLGIGAVEVLLFKWFVIRKCAMLIGAVDEPVKTYLCKPSFACLAFLVSLLVSLLVWLFF